MAGESQPAEDAVPTELIIVLATLGPAAILAAIALWAVRARQRTIQTRFTSVQSPRMPSRAQAQGVDEHESAVLRTTWL